MSEQGDDIKILSHFVEDIDNILRIEVVAIAAS